MHPDSTRLITLADVKADPSLREHLHTSDLYYDADLVRYELEELFEGRKCHIGWLPGTGGYKPWMPMIEEVWSHRGVSPTPKDGAGYYEQERWTEAFEILLRLYDEYQASKERKDE